MTTYSFICFPMTSYDYYTLSTMTNTMVMRFSFYSYCIIYMFYMFRSFTKLQMRKGCFSFFSSFWNLVGYMLVLTMVASATLFIIFFLDPKRKLFRRTDVMVRQLGAVDDGFPELNDLANFYELIFLLDGFAMMLIYLHLFKFFSISKQIDIIWLALYEVSGALATFILIFSIIFAGFVFSANIAYGPYMRSFATLSSSFGSLVRLVMGEFDYDSMRIANYLVTPIFICLFTALVTMILVNIFIAILGDGYSKVNTQLLEERKRDPPRTIWQDVQQFFSDRKLRKQMRDVAAKDMVVSAAGREKKRQMRIAQEKRDEAEEKRLNKLKAKFEKKEKRRLQKVERKKKREEEKAAALEEARRIEKEEERERKREAKAEMLARQQAIAKEKQKKLKSV